MRKAWAVLWLGVTWCGSVSAQSVDQIMASVERRCRAVSTMELEAQFSRVKVSEALETGLADHGTAVCRFNLGDPSAPALEENLSLIVVMRPPYSTVSEAQSAFHSALERDKGNELRRDGNDIFYVFCRLGNEPERIRLCATVRKDRVLVSVVVLSFNHGLKIDNNLFRQSVGLALKYAERVNPK